MFGPRKAYIRSKPEPIGNSLGVLLGLLSLFTFVSILFVSLAPSYSCQSIFQALMQISAGPVNPKGAHLVYHFLYVLICSLSIDHARVDTCFGVMLVGTNYYFFGRTQN
jgi:hypothetical protein